MFTPKEQNDMLHHPLVSPTEGLSIQCDPEIFPQSNKHHSRVDTQHDAVPWDSDGASDDDAERDAHAENATTFRHKASAFYLGRLGGRRFGFMNVDPEHSRILRMWTNIRGRKVQVLLSVGWILALVALYWDITESLWSLFNAHMALMVTSLSLMSEGVIAYRAGHLRSGQVNVLRNYHRAVLCFTIVCIACGVVAIVVHKTEEGHSLNLHTTHSILGVSTIVAILLQAQIGIIKRSKLNRNQGKIFRWHGNTGQILYILFVLTAVFGFYELKYVTLKSVWLFFTAIVITVLTVIAVMYQPTSLGADQFDQVAPTREVQDHDVELLATSSFADPPPPMDFSSRTIPT